MKHFTGPVANDSRIQPLDSMAACGGMLSGSENSAVKPPVTMKYYLGGGIDFPHPKHIEKNRSGITSGSVLVGQNASIMAGSRSQGSRIIPETAMKETSRPPKRAFRCKGRTHFDNWTLACKGEDTAMSPFEYAGRGDQ